MQVSLQYENARFGRDCARGHRRAAAQRAAVKISAQLDAEQRFDWRQDSDTIVEPAASSPPPPVPISSVSISLLSPPSPVSLSPTLPAPPADIASPSPRRALTTRPPIERPVSRGNSEYSELTDNEDGEPDDTNKPDFSTLLAEAASRVETAWHPGDGEAGTFFTFDGMSLNLGLRSHADDISPVADLEQSRIRPPGRWTPRKSGGKRRVHHDRKFIEKRPRSSIALSRQPKATLVPTQFTPQLHRAIKGAYTGPQKRVTQGMAIPSIEEFKANGGTYVSWDG